MKGAATGQLHLITSKSGRGGSIPIHQDADLYLGKLSAGQSVTRALAPGRHAWLHVAEGEITLNGQPLRSGDAAAVSGEPALELRSAENSQVLLFDLQ